ncbi:MAG: hypothetical protein SFZ03_02755 [Candidatus Melainabacteria bacterium]|nr:hypothetical protein [Candidatus Melainabacteria bacterium]
MLLRRRTMLNAGGFLPIVLLLWLVLQAVGWAPVPAPVLLAQESGGGNDDGWYTLLEDNDPAPAPPVIYPPGHPANARRYYAPGEVIPYQQTVSSPTPGQAPVQSPAKQGQVLSPSGVPGALNLPADHSPTPQKNGRKWWPFGNKKQAEAPPPKEEDIVNVGPRLSVARPDPLLRLPVAIRVDEQLIPAGFYLVRQTTQPTMRPTMQPTMTTTASANANPSVERHISVWKGSLRLFELTLTAAGSTNEPVTYYSEAKPEKVYQQEEYIGDKKEPVRNPYTRIQTEPLSQGSQLKVVLLEANQRFESPPLDTVYPLRPR